MDPYKFEPNDQFVTAFSKAIVTFGKRYNQYEIRGFEQVPRDRPVLFVFYHGFMPLDLFYFGMSYRRLTGQPICALTAKMGLKIPLLKNLLKSVGAIAGNQEAALKVLKSGVSVGVAPGGLWEAISGHDKDYQLQWGDRSGFAKLAIDAGVTIYPAFTENVESMYRNLCGGSQAVKTLYDLTKFPFTPFLGIGFLPFPVKITTHIGDPIQPALGESHQDLAQRCKLALQALMDQKQKRPLSGWTDPDV